MATCNGDVPITTKVDESTQELLDELAGGMGVSRAEILRRLLELYHQSEDGDLQCPSCTQPIRIRTENVELTTEDHGEIPANERTDRIGYTEAGEDTTVETSEPDSVAMPSSDQSRICELESVIESQQQELEDLRLKMAEQEKAIDELSESGISPQYLENLEAQIERRSDETRRMIPRIEALTQVSDLSNPAICPTCGDELTVEQSFTDLGEPSAIECAGCGLVVGHRE